MAAQPNDGGPPRAVLLDALGTLIRLLPPAPRLAERLGIPVAEAGRAVKAEIAFYRANLHRGRDQAGLGALRRDCARIVRDELGLDLPLDQVEEILLDSIRFAAYDDVPPALARLRELGVRLVVLSNWDVSLHEVLAQTGLRALVHGAVSSAELGVAKPDPAAFRHALTMAGVKPEWAWHVGDSVEADVEGARRSGIKPLLIARPEEPEPDPLPAGVRMIRSLAEVPELCA
jgi:putative hydrolase of the HAD superfamily